jgi:hypothetical protein
MAMIGPVGPRGPFLPPERDQKLTRRRKSSYEQSSAAGADVDVDLEASAADDDIDAALMARFPPGSGPINWIARLIFQTYHSVLRPKLGRIIDILA